MRFLQNLILLTCIVTIACGSSVGNNGAKVNNTGLAYTGITSQAAVTQYNWQPLAVGAYQQGQTDSGIGIGAVGISSSNNIRPRGILVSQTLINGLKAIDVTSLLKSMGSDGVSNRTASIFGNCGGRGDYTIEIDDVTGAFNGTMNFFSFCSMNSIISGGTTFSGVINLITQNFVNSKYTFNALTCAHMRDSITLQGSIASSFTAATDSINMTALVQDNTTGQVYKIDNLQLELTYSGNYFDARLSGVHFDPQYGYIVLSTSLPVRFYDTAYWPFQGEVIVNGNAGTRARLTVTSVGEFIVAVDTNGDGLFNHSTGSIAWNSM